jgi:hypothetical protein
VLPAAFIIMQIGREDLDQVCDQAIVPALQACGFTPYRVDKHNQGGLLKSEIIQYIQDADIIVADLTNERPNVYLEIGYAMGIDKFSRLILTVREDHFPDNPNYRPDGPKVHFDLSGYDILAWSPDGLEEFRSALKKRIQRRLATTERGGTLDESRIWDVTWITEQREMAFKEFESFKDSGFMEVRASIHPPKISRGQTDLRRAAREAPIHTFGWPIGIYLDRSEAQPKPRTDGIVATVRSREGATFDYWAIRRSGDFYTLLSFL